ncbi:MAG: acetoin utilization protein AcuC [Candidatus Thorarchaeota archaeon]
MRGRLQYPYSEALMDYEFRTDHPLKPDRLRLTYELSRELGLLESVNLFKPTMPTRDDIELFHTPDYIDAVIECGDSLSPKPEYGLGTSDNPVFPRLYDAASRYVGATLDAMKEIIKGASNAFVISGGLHHAHRSMASGFCIFNDVVISVLHLLKQKSAKVLYFDFDAHHGDGVQNAFYKSKNVLTISVHQTGQTLFPGTGFIHEMGGGEGLGYSVNIPVLPGASSEELIQVVDEVVVPLFKSFEPNLLVTQLGVDGHFMDPLAYLGYTTYGFESALQKLKKLADDICDIGWLAVGGGGYHPVNVARLWSLFLATILGKGVPKELPESFRERCIKLGYHSFPEGMRDENPVVQAYLPREQVALDLDRIVRRLKEMVFPYHGIA